MYDADNKKIKEHPFDKIVLSRLKKIKQAMLLKKKNKNKNTLLPLFFWK
jgi:hypothetical protein